MQDTHATLTSSTAFLAESPQPLGSFLYQRGRRGAADPQAGMVTKTGSESAARTPSRGMAAQVLGSSPVVRVARWTTRGHLPVLAYHDVADAAAFAVHLDIIQEDFTPVSGNDVGAALVQQRQLPRRAIWLTFDDANPGVVTNALPLLVERGVPATLFVCPGVIDTDEPYWWQVVDRAIAVGHKIEVDGRKWQDRSVITHLKGVPDDVRRATVARVQEEMVEAGHDLVRVLQATSDSLRDWLEAGLELGNHTWDHPCLDTCDDEEQLRQVVNAHEWLRAFVGAPTTLFAYPNGNTAPTSRRVLTDHGYAVTALFDHRLSRVRSREISRLRVDAAAPAHRLRAIYSGAHPAAYALAQRLRAARNTKGGHG